MTKLTKTIEFGFYLFLFLLPWQTRLIWHDAFLNHYVWEYGRFSLYGSELVLWFVLLLFMVWLFKNYRFTQFDLGRIWQRLKNPLVLSHWLLVIFLLFAGLSIFWSIDPGLAYYQWFRLLEGAALFSLVLLFHFSLKRIALVWVATAAVQGVFAIEQFFTQYIFANKWLGLAEHFSTLAGSIILQTDTERWLRAYGSLPHPNILAGFLVLALIFLFYLVITAQTRFERFFVLFSLVLILPALFFTFSRSAWIAFILSLVFFGGWLWRRRDYQSLKIFSKFLLITVLIITILMVMFFEPVKTRIVGEQDLEVASIYLRMEFNKQAWEIIQQRPWLGVGTGNYTLGVYDFVNKTWPGYYYQPVHNLFLLIGAELGLVALLIFLAALILLLYLSIRRLDSLAGLTTFLALLSVLVISLFDHYFWTLYFGLIIFWLVLALNLKQSSAAE